MDNSKLKIHFGYIVGILLLVIILLLVFNFGNNANLVNYISFAVGMISIFLAVISIIYAFYSNFSQSAILGKIDVASENLNIASKDVKQNSEILSSELKELRNIIENIPDNIEKISSKIDLTNDILVSNNSSSNKLKKIEQGQSEEFLKTFYQDYSTIGMIGLYIACLCSETNKEFDFEKTGIEAFNPNEYIGVRNYYYLYGCFVTLSSLYYLLQVEQNTDNAYVFKITFLSNDIKKEEIKSVLMERDDIGQKDLIKQIDKYFN